tara:strand:- start:1000 stop:2010 length:1011 start_codon:yes stop_codon:yes gene_type:complete
MKKYLNIKILIPVIGIILFFLWNRSPSVEWEKEINWEILSEAKYVKQTDDGGYVILGTNYSQLTLVKVNSIGNTLWVKKIIEDKHNATAFQLSNDGGYMIAGYHYSPNASNRKFWIAKLDTAANVIWSKEYDDGIYRQEIIAIEGTDNGDYIVAGVNYNDSIHSTDYWVSKIDSEGELSWSKIFGGTNTDTPYIMRKTKNEKFVIEGNTDSKDGDVPEKYSGRLPNSIWSIEVNDNGQIVNSQRKEPGLFSKLTKTIFTHDGEYLLAGTKWVGDVYDGSVDLFVEKYNANFNQTWSVIITAPGADRIIAIEQTNDGGCIVLAANEVFTKKLIKLSN